MNPHNDFDRDKQGIQDATVSDFLLPYLMGKMPFLKMPAGAGAGAAPAAAAEDAYGTELREGLMQSMEQPAKGYAMGGVVGADLGDVPIPGQPNVPQGTSPMPAILSQAQNLGAQATGGYTPQMRNQLYSAMLQGQNSMPSAVGNGLASVGDAIARGYGRDQTNFLDKSLQNQKDAVQGGLGAFDASQKMGMAQTQAGMEIGKMDPSSQMSKMSQEAYAGPLKKLGYDDATIAKMPASQIESVTQVALKYGDIEAQKELKEATLALTAKMNEAQIGAMKASAQARQDELKRQKEESNKNLDVEASKHWLAHPELAAAARTRLAAGAGGGAPAPAPASASGTVPAHVFASEQDAEKANLPDGTPIVIGGVKGTWRHK